MDVPVVLEVEPLVVLLFGAPLDVAALFWAVVVGLDELVLLPLPVLLAAGPLGAAVELLESALVCAYARPITVTAAAAAMVDTMDLRDVMLVLLWS
jgi:hypothetical protein